MGEHENWREILGPIDPEQLELHRRLVRADLRLSTLRLGDLRRRLGISQSHVAEALDVSQPNVSRIEQEEDIRLSTLGRYVAALGGHLEVNAVFPDETVGLLRDPGGDGRAPGRR